MFCKNCGSMVNPGMSFCSNCGTPVPTEAAAPVAAPEYNYAPTNYAPNYAPVAAPNNTPILVFGILALAFACTFYFSFLGIIFGAINNGKVKTYLSQGGVIAGKAKVGRILGKVGFILGIVFTVLVVIILIAAMSY